MTRECWHREQNQACRGLLCLVRFGEWCGKGIQELLSALWKEGSLELGNGHKFQAKQENVFPPEAQFGAEFKIALEPGALWTRGIFSEDNGNVNRNIK